MYKILKRFLDLFIATIALVILSPLLVAIILVLLVTGEHEVFYLQERIGTLNKPFKIIKFATMIKDSPNIGTGSITLRNDPRVTRVGRFLRRTKINELPQVFNVLLGNMSLVGPRPQMMVDFMKFPELIRQFIYKSKPGITGVGSIIFRDEERLLSAHQGDHHEFYRQHIAPYKGELEIWYQKNASIGVDLLLMFITFWVVVFPKSNLIFLMFKSLPPRPENLIQQ